MKIRIRSLAEFLILTALPFGIQPLVSAQQTTALIQGTVSDSTGALLQGATVTIVNTSTGISTAQNTDSKGYFAFPHLHIGGPYTLSVESRGFLKFVSNRHHAGP